MGLSLTLQIISHLLLDFLSHHSGSWLVNLISRIFSADIITFMAVNSQGFIYRMVDILCWGKREFYGVYSLTQF